MKANELMLGDLVLLFSETPARVDAIGNTEVYVYEKERGDWHVGYEHIKPIPITPEILEKNGFGCRDAWVIPGEDFRLRQVGNSWAVLPYYADYNALILCHIAYLHELQHLLHLCGIDKEITI